ncbi:MAG: signal peptidase I [Candidatus Nanohalobium sp.]
MEFFENIMDGESELFEWFYFLSLALILAFGTIKTTGTVLQTDKPVVSVVSCSMYPEYQKGDILVVDGMDYSEIEEGDVVIYRVPDRIDFTLNGESYTLEKNSPMYNTSVETSVGTVQLLEAEANLKTGNDRALLSIEGEKVTVTDGGSVSVNGARLKVERISAMPIPVVHRVISKSEDHLETKGDANSGQLDFESSVRPFQIHGTTMFKIPRVGAVKLLAMDLIGFQPGNAPVVIENSYSCRG